MDGGLSSLGRLCLVYESLQLQRVSREYRKVLQAGARVEDTANMCDCFPTTMLKCTVRYAIIAWITSVWKFVNAIHDFTR